MRSAAKLKKSDSNGIKKNKNKNNHNNYNDGGDDGNADASSGDDDDDDDIHDDDDDEETDEEDEEEDIECPVCAPQNATVRAIRRAQAESAHRHDMFVDALGRSKDGFGTVSEWFGRGVMNK